MDGPTADKQILCLAKYGPLAASTRHRFLQFFPYLREAGLSTTLSSLLDDDYLSARYASGRAPLISVGLGALGRVASVLRARNFDAGWLAYELLPYAPSRLEQSLWPARVPFALDVDDATFHLYDQSDLAAVRAVLSSKIAEVGRRAAAVLAGSDYLVDYFERQGARVHAVPTVVDTEVYAPGPRAGGREELVIGWMGTPATVPFLDAAAEALDRFARESGATVRLVGASPGALSAIPAQTRSWSEAAEVSEIRDFDVGIMPLPDTPFTRGKCAFKLIQYMACGVPVVASPVGANRRIVSESGAGYLASTTDEWLEALASLARDPDMRARMGRAGRRHVERRYSLTKVAPQVVKILAAVAGAS